MTDKSKIYTKGYPKDMAADTKYKIVMVPAIVTGPGKGQIVDELLTAEQREQVTAGGRDLEFSSDKLKSLTEGAMFNVQMMITPTQRNVINVAPMSGDERPVPSPIATGKPTKKGKTLTVKKGEVLFSNDAKRLFQMTAEIAKSEGFTTVLIGGPSGYGKTSLCKAFADRQGMTFVKINAGIVRIPEEWFGQRRLEGDRTFFDLNEASKAIKAGNAFVLYDELNRAEAPILNGLFTLLDFGRVDVLGETIEVGKNVIFGATINQGTEYTGTFELDRALSNRFAGKLVVGPMPAEAEAAILVANYGISQEDADLIVRAVNKLRDIQRSNKLRYDVSTRCSTQVAKYVKFGAGVKEAFGFVLTPFLPAAEAKNVTDNLNMVSGMK